MRVYLKYSDRHPEPKVAEINSTRVVLFGIGFWGLALIVIGAFYSSLSDAGLGWWLHTAIIGVLLGFLALYMVRKR